MYDTCEELNVCLYGQFSLHTSAERDITPRGKKASALIVLLAECDDMKRSRRWIEEKLWSDRGADQARGSLRQTLFELRKQLGDLGDILQSDRTSVWLLRERVRVMPPSVGRAFLEGFDAPDPEFEDWLTRKRLAHGRPGENITAPDGTVRIQCGLPWTATQSDPVAAQILNDQVGGIISGFIAKSTRGVFDKAVDMIVRASMEEVGKSNVVAVQIIDAKRDELVHSDHIVVDDVAKLLSDSVETSQFCWRVADAALDHLAKSRSESDAAAMRAAWSQEAVRAVLSFDKSVMPQSLDILEEASSQLDDGLFHALRGWAMMSLIMEERLEETQETLGEIRATLDRAQRQGPGDPMVNGLVANVHAILFEDYERAMSLSMDVLKRRPDNIFATQALSLGRFSAGALDVAYSLSKRNRDISEATKYGAMCNLHHALICLRTRRPDEAIDASRAAADAMPAYRAPSRQLVALYASRGNMDAATRQAETLSAVEPGFSVDRLLFDDEYPANTLRETGTLAAAARGFAEGS